MEPNVDRGMWSVVALLAAIVIGGVVLLAFPRFSGKIANSMDDTVNKAFKGERPSWSEEKEPEDNGYTEKDYEGAIYLNDEDFEFVADQGDGVPNEYTIDDVTKRGYFRYIGEHGPDETLVIPKEIRGNKVKDYYGMFTLNEQITTQKIIHDNPNVVNMHGMFSAATAFNGDISKWNTSNVKDMNFMFNDAIAFNGDISGWNTSNVEKMSGMFYNAQAFNRDISDWNTSKVTNMDYMFAGAKAFNQDISKWDVSKDTANFGMFDFAESFNPDYNPFNKN